MLFRVGQKLLQFWSQNLEVRENSWSWNKTCSNLSGFVLKTGAY